jgi:prepilin-type N-terminal cleavage/methylation domain-containing protein
MQNAARPRRKGFTLIELLVVIVIIAILAALLIVLVKGMIDRSRNAATKALISTLDKGCQDYKTDFGLFPPNSPYSESQNLHFYLGSPRWVVTQHGSGGSPDIVTTMPPLIEFKRENLDPSASSSYPTPPVYVYDHWQKPMKYASPGTVNAKSVDIWSLGRDSADAADDISNYIRDF